jgi:hypothetical protein
MKNSKDIIYRIAEKLDQSEKGYTVPTITYRDNKETILVDYPKGKRFLVTVIDVTGLERDEMI